LQRRSRTGRSRERLALDLCSDQFKLRSRFNINHLSRRSPDEARSIQEAATYNFELCVLVAAADLADAGIEEQSQEDEEPTQREGSCRGV
jgi:hypothetical protein